MASARRLIASSALCAVFVASPLSAFAWHYPTPTPKPTSQPSCTPKPSHTPKPTCTPKVTHTAAPTPKPTPCPTPRPTIAPTAIGQPPTPVDVCHHDCPDKLRYGKSGKPDMLTVRSAFGPGATILDDDSVSISLKNAGGTIYSASLQAGDLTRHGRKLMFIDKGARTGAGIRGGISSVAIQDVSQGLGTRVTIVVFGDLSAATDPTMTLKVRVGDEANAVTDTWEEKHFGWLRVHR